MRLLEMDENVCDPTETPIATTGESDKPLAKAENEEQQQSTRQNIQSTQEESSLEEQKPSLLEPAEDPKIAPNCGHPATAAKQPKTPPPQDEAEQVQEELQDEEETVPSSAHEMLLKTQPTSYSTQMDESVYDRIKMETGAEAEQMGSGFEAEKMDTARPQAVKEETAPEKQDTGEIEEEMEIKSEPVEVSVKQEELLAGEPKKTDDEGEIVSDQEDAVPESSSVQVDKKKSGKKRKRSKSGEENEEPRSKTVALEDEGQSPRNRKTALEQLRSMKFSKKDPFNDGREHRTYRFTRDISPIRNRGLDSDTDKSRRSGGNDRRGPANKLPTRNFNNNNNSNNESANGENSLTEEQRRQRSTMFLLQNEQQLHQQHTQLPAILQKSAGVGPLKQRIENLLALPDDQVFNLPFQELKVLLLHAVELSQEQSRLLNGRKAQLIELDQMIKKEKDLIERISQDLPPQYRPNLSDELVLPKGSPPAHTLFNAKNNGSSVANGSFQKLANNFSMPPPIFNELTTPLANAPPLGYPPMPFQPNQPPPALPQLPADQPNSSVAVSGFPLANMGVPPPMAPPSAAAAAAAPPPPPATMFSQPPPIIPAVPTSSSTYSMTTHTITNTSVPPPTASFASAPHVPPPAIPVSITSTSFNPSQPPPNLPTINFSIPPPSTQSDQNKGQIEKSHSTSSLPSLTQFNVPPPQINTPGHPPFSIPPPSSNKPGIDVSVPPPTIGLGAKSGQQPSVSTASVNLSQPPPNIQHQKPPPNYAQNVLNQNQAQLQSQHQLQQQMQALLQPDLTSVPPPNLALQLATAPLSLLGKQQGSNSNNSNQSGGGNNTANRGTATPPRPSGPPRPLMSIDQPPPPGLMERIAANSAGLGGLVPNQQTQPQQNKKTPASSNNSNNNRNQPRQQQQQHQQQKLRQARQAQFNKPRSRNHSPQVVSGANAIPVSSEAGLRREKSPLVELGSFNSAGFMSSNLAESLLSRTGSFTPPSVAVLAPVGESCLVTGGVLQVKVQTMGGGDQMDSQLQNISPVGNE